MLILLNIFFIVIKLLVEFLDLDYTFFHFCLEPLGGDYIFTFLRSKEC